VGGCARGCGPGVGGQVSEVRYCRLSGEGTNLRDVVVGGKVLCILLEIG